MKKAIYIGTGNVDNDGDWYDNIKCPHCGKIQRDYGYISIGHCNKCDKEISLGDDNQNDITKS